MNYIVKKESLDLLANSIRNKAGITDELEFPFGWKTVIDEINSSEGSTSSEGMVWTKSNVIEDIPHLKYANGVYVAGGENLYYSTDGKSWTSVDLGENESNIIIQKLYWADGTWILSTAKYSYYSKDGKTWVKIFENDQFHEVNYGDGLWIADGKEFCYFSTDGINWSQLQSLRVLQTGTLFYLNGIWFANEIASNDENYTPRGQCYSLDGLNWEACEPASDDENAQDIDFYTMSYAKGVWVGCNGYQLYYSLDGKTWTLAISDDDTEQINNPLYHNGNWVAIGAYGIYRSTDGKNWEYINVTENEEECLITQGDYWNDGLWIVSGDFESYWSEDSITWNLCDKSILFPIKANGLWVAGLYDMDDDKYGLTYSTNGKNWSLPNWDYGFPWPILNANGVWIINFESGGLYYCLAGNATAVDTIPDGSAITFGYENSEPVEREEQYAIASADLNELGAVTQKMAGKRALMTVADMIYWLNRVQFIPQGSAESAFALNFASAASGILPDVQRGTATSAFALNFTSSASGALQED